MVDPVEDDAAGEVVPVRRLRDDVVVRVAAVHLRRDPPPLPGQLVRIRGIPPRPEVGEMPRLGEVDRHS